MEMNRASNNLQIYKGTVLGKSHKVEAFLGEGGFGLVTKCHNRETGKCEAIKANKNHPDIVHQTRKEIAILKRLRCLNPDTSGIVRWNGFFFDKDHICQSFELLDQSLCDYMEDRNNRGLPMAELRSTLFQLTRALNHLKDAEIIHADLKPENIMIVDRQQKPFRVKLIDFGLACPASAVKPGVCVQTTWYRAPEVILRIPFDEAIDVWSLGLIAAELAIGFPLYPGATDYDILNFIMKTQGQPADYVLDRGMGTKNYFRRKANGWRFKTPEEFRFETGFHASDTRHIRLRDLDDLERLLDCDRGRHNDHHLLVDLIKRMLHLDPDRRIKPQEVLQHPFFLPARTQSSPVDVCIDMTDFEQETVETDQLSSWYKTAAPLTAHSQETDTEETDEEEVDEEETDEQETDEQETDEEEVDEEETDEQETDEEEVDVWPPTEAENIGWFRSLIRGMTEAFYFHFLRDK